VGIAIGEQKRSATMSLIKPSVPGDVLRAFTSGLGNFINSGSPLWSLLLDKYSAIQAYNLNLSWFCRIVSTSEVASLKTLPDDFFQSSGWRFLAAEGDLYGGAHVGSIIPGQPPKLTGFSDSVQILPAIERFEELPNVSLPPGDFEIRILRITWLHFEAFWLYWLPPGGGTVGPQQRGTDVIVPYIGFVESATGGQLSAMDASLLPDFLRAIFPRAQAVCAQSLAREAAVHELQARQIQKQADAQESSASVLKSRASALDVQAKTAAQAAAQAQVRANINNATAKQIEVALGLTSSEAEGIFKYTKDQGIRSWEDLGKVVDLNKLRGKQIGFGRSSS
jgi:DNA uptake protein ComE-like DNA-binding protein